MPFFILIAFVAVLYPELAVIGPWAVVAVFATGVVVIQMVRAQRVQVPLLQLAAFEFFLQLCIAPLFAYSMPPWGLKIPSERYPEYMPFAVCSCVALYIGCLIGSRGTPKIPYSPPTNPSDYPSWWKWSKRMCVGGMLVFLTYHSVLPGSLTFIGQLVANLRWVGLIALILANDRHWKAYAALLLGVELLLSINSGAFGEVIFWSQAIVLVIAYRYHWKWQTVVILMVSIFVLSVFQSFKEDFKLRATAVSGAQARLSLLGEMAADRFRTPGYLTKATTYAPIVQRFNQGAIVDRVMQTVPAVEPYAGGSTLADDAEAVFLPRFVAEDKLAAGGREYFERFTHLTLNSFTSMTISTIGELYANFGSFGGIVGMGLVGLLTGLIYRRIAQYVVRSPLWWAWVPYVLLLCAKPEEDLGTVWTFTFKAAIVMAAVVFAASRSGTGMPDEPVRPTVAP